LPKSQTDGLTGDITNSRDGHCFFDLKEIDGLMEN